MIIRKLSEADDEVFEQIRLHSLQDNPEAYGSSFDEEFENTAIRFRQRLQLNPANCVLGVFDDDGEIQGMLGVARGAKLKTIHLADLWGLYIRPNFRGRGAARQLLEEALKLVRSFPRIEQVRIKITSESAAAERLCADFGFTRYGREVRAFKAGDRYYDVDHLVYFIRQPEWIIGRMTETDHYYSH